MVARGRRHLFIGEAAAALRRERSVAQFLGGFTAVDGRVAVRWVTVGLDEGVVVVRLHEVEDMAVPGFFDLWSSRRSTTMRKQVRAALSSAPRMA